MYRFAARDAVLVLLALSFWFLATTVQTLALPAAIGAGLVAFQLHEWGHWLGARTPGTIISPVISLLPPFLFNFDSAANSRRQFLAMSWPGFVATAWFFVEFQWWLPPSHPATKLTQGPGIRDGQHGGASRIVVPGRRSHPASARVPARQTMTDNDGSLSV